MVIILREQKGTPLTAAEVDGNFKDISKRLSLLESLQPVQERVTKIEQEGDMIVFKGDLGSEWGRVKLPIMQMNFRGSWDDNLQYHLNDIIKYQDKIYLCASSHISRNFTADDSKWMELFATDSQSKNYPQINTSVSVGLPLMTKDEILTPTLGSLAIFIGDQTPELLLGDIDCWRKVRDLQPLKIP